jgi:hypothetical protein
VSFANGPSPHSKEKSKMRKTMFAIVVTVLTVLALSSTTRAKDDDRKLSAVPDTFVGGVGDCGPGYPAGSKIGTSAWLGGMGLPDDGSSPDTPSNDPHKGLLLSKNGPTTDCSAAGAVIKGAEGILVTTTFALGFDYRNGGHCGAGAPRFNIMTDDSVFHFGGGCANGTHSAATQDPAQWTRVRIAGSDAGQMFPPLTPGTHITSLEIIFDEGTDTANNDTEGIGLAVIDNIFINDDYITSGDRHGGQESKDRDDDKE